ncbi:hypothetical protein JIN84_05565 [Luteolibacter yonseiensis]|uniref:Uncharacterized protein n=1 Tax=Luteolibacter yonseiensis TaxID=1144680 RepID=A0A934R2U5_9BACT|nr:hypothetical protein [Luteolibacter yonseiensis]MBK1815068.1 hypothetical protein [Luteolibacter yonseiensis]
MNYHDFRRAALGLTLHGPFSRNRRRRREVRPLVSAGVVFSAGMVVGWLAGLLV